MGTDQGTVYVMKAPSRDIASIRGPVLVYMKHELYEHPAAPVIRTVVRIHDRPDSALVFEAFVNVGDPQQRADFAVLQGQRELHLLFYDENLRHRLTKRVRNAPSEMTELVLDQATSLLARVPRDQFDFDRAKADVMKQTGL